jgi:catechol 2,3-dioxygenase-like lactoylglutathione lyase family enzyme
MKIVAVDHVQIAVPPQLEAAAVDFYGRVLGLRRLPKPEGTEDPRGAWFDGGNVQVHIGVQGAGFTPAMKAHVGFVVDDLAALQTALEAANSATKPGSDLPGFKRIFTQDPAGNRLEFLQRTA